MPRASANRRRVQCGGSYLAGQVEFDGRFNLVVRCVICGRQFLQSYKKVAPTTVPYHHPASCQPNPALLSSVEKRPG